MNNDVTLSAICVLTDEDPQIPKIIRTYLRSLAALPCSCELTLVDNGGLGDLSQELLGVLEENDIPTSVVSLHCCGDESTAIRAGLRSSNGEVVALLPAYLQSDPEALGEMLDEVEGGADYVASWRCPRIDAKMSGLKSGFFNRVTRLLSGVNLHDINSGLRLIRREVVQHVPIYGDMHRFWPILAARQGYRVTEVITRHLEERTQKGDYRAGVYLRRMLDLLTLFFLIKFTRKPLRFFGLMGSSAIAIGSVTLLLLVVQRMLGVPLADRPLLALGLLLVVLGIQLFSLGLLGELIIFTHARHMKDHHIKSVYTSRQTTEEMSHHA